MESRGIPFEDTAPKLAATVVTLTVLALTVLPLRFYIRIRNKTWGMDDWTMAIATVCQTFLCQQHAWRLTASRFLSPLSQPLALADLSEVLESTRTDLPSPRRCKAFRYLIVCLVLVRTKVHAYGCSGSSSSRCSTAPLLSP